MDPTITSDDILGKVDRAIPTMMNYQTHIDKESMFNTPPVLPIFSALQTLRWLKAQGGVELMEKKNIEKSGLLYDEIDRNKCFKATIKNVDDRSRMNVCFVMNEGYESLEKEFLDLTAANDMVGLKGHRSVGGFRASVYNALPKESVEALVALMQDFEAKH